MSRLTTAIILLAAASAASVYAPASATQSAEEVPPRLPAADFGKMPLYGNMELSPDGKYLAYIMPLDGRGHVIIELADAGDEKPSLIPPINNFDIDWITWANDSRLLIAYSTTAKGDWIGTRVETRLMAADARVTRVVNIVRPQTNSRMRVKHQAQLQTKIVDMLPDDPNHILLSLDSMRTGGDSVVKINVYSGKQSIILRPRKGFQSWVADQQGVPRLGYGFRNRNSEPRLRYHNPESGNWMDLQETHWYEADFSLVAFMEDPRYAYAIGPVEGRETLVRLNIPSGEIEDVLFAHEKVDIGGLMLDPTGRKVIGALYTEDFAKVHYFESRMQIIQNTVDKLLPDTFNRISQSLPGGKLFLIAAQNDHNPIEYYVLDLASNELYFLVATRPQLNPEEMARVEAVTYLARDGVEIQGYVTYPRGRARKNLPAIILPHGGPHSRDTMDFDYLAQFLANRGYLVLQPNFRGSTGYGKAFRDAGERQWGGLMQDDVTDGTNWLIVEGLADPARICIVGWSYGGYAALMGAVKTPNLFKCAASINGVADLPALVNYDKKFIGGSYWTRSITLDEEGRRAASPHHRAAETKIPVFLAAAKDDVRVPYEQSKDFYGKIRKRVPAVYLQLKKGGHSLEHEKMRISMLEGLDAFLAEHLPVGE